MSDDLKQRAVDRMRDAIGLSADMVAQMQIPGPDFHCVVGYAPAVTMEAMRLREHAEAMEKALKAVDDHEASIPVIAYRAEFPAEKKEGE